MTHDRRGMLLNAGGLAAVALSWMARLAGSQTAAAVFLVVVYVLSDLRAAPWLPTWRRFLPALFIALSELAFWGKREALGAGCSLLWLACFLWNWWTASSNKRGGKDPNASTSSEHERLTTVQRTAFRREVTGAA